MELSMAGETQLKTVTTNAVEDEERTRVKYERY